MPEETRFDELKRYVAFDARDAGRLVAFLPKAEDQFERISREFYDGIREHEEAHAVLQDEAQIQRLQRSLVAWMRRLLSGRYDEAYFDETAKIGRVHVKVRLPQRYMFTAMALIRRSLSRLVDERVDDGADATRDALHRLLDLELAIMLEAYREAFVDRVQKLERTERDQLSRALSRTEQRYAAAMKLARFVVIGLGRSGEIVLFNDDAERLTGFERDEVVGQSFVDLFVQEDLVESHGAEVRRVVDGDVKRATVTTALRARNGRYRDVRLELASLDGHHADEVVAFALGVDVTEEKALAERTRQAERLATVGTLAAGLAHEIRNPLNGAKLHVAYLERSLAKQKASADVVDAVRVIGDEITRLANLVTEFLDFARPRPPDKKRFSMFAWLDRVWPLLVAKGEAADVRIVRDLPTRDIEPHADAAKLQQVLLNLVGNGIEAIASKPKEGSPKGTVTVRVRRSPRNVTLEVADDGPGLPSVSAPIFDAFYSTKADGTGLGLAIAHRIVTDHQGTITVDSTPQGVTFRIVLPIDSPSHPPEAP
ncbi:MAG: protoglobin domain-containing protein [Polyangiaceae bacterium]